MPACQPDLLSSLRLGLTLVLTAALTACSSAPQSQTPGLDPVATYSYEPGTDYSWTSVTQGTDMSPGTPSSPWRGLAVSAAGEATDLDLTSGSWDSATNGYGPIEIDRSNNSSTAGDGRTLTIGGVAYAKGLGAHANSDIRYTLPGQCTTFTASIGVDDEVGDRGSVVFEVWNGTAAKLYDSSVLRGSNAAKTISVPLSGVQQLRLVVRDASDGVNYDHADWAATRLLGCTVSQTSGNKYLSDLTPIGTPLNGYGPYEKDKSNGGSAGGDGKTLTIGGTAYPKGLGAHAASSLTYDLNGTCSTFTVEVGVDDEVGDQGTVVFQVFSDGTKLYDSGIMTGRDSARSVNVNVASKKQLMLKVTDAGNGISYDHADWANAKVSCSDIQPTVTGVTVNPSTAVLSVKGRRQFTADVQGSGAYSSAVTWTSSSPSVATVSSSGLVTAIAPGTATITATSTFDTSKKGTAQVTVNPASTLPTGGILINFQPASSGTPAGYTRDTGAAYDTSRGFGWVREDSVGTGTSVPLDITPNTRDRALAGVDARLNTFIHMQFPTSVSNATAVRTPAAWEYALPNGVYTVTVAVGEASNSYDSFHQINVEGHLAIARYNPVASKKFFTSTMRASVTDGRLTIDARGGTNTKLDYLSIQPGDQPSIRSLSPQDAETIVPTTVSVTADVNLPNSGIDGTTLFSSTVRLLNMVTNVPVPASLNTSGGGDVIVLQPSAPLSANTQYIFEVTSGVKDTSGMAFLPQRTTFVTGSSTGSTGTVAFEQVALPNAPAKPYTAVEMGPDGKLYAATLIGDILRFGVMSDGTVTTPQVMTSVQAASGGPRTIIGMKFDPTSTADNLILWISNNHFWDGTANSPDWSGKITRLSGPNLENVQDYVVGFPRSIRDHQTNSIAFRPGDPGALYVLQGSNSAMGAPDTAWGNRPERLLSAALLRVDYSKISNPPLDVKTGDGGVYNPYAAGAPVTIYASGIRNAYDMVWHTNGQLYVPTNGSAAGGNTPATPATLPASCQTRPDGPYTGPAVPALASVGVQHDFLFRVVKGGYYGHPNPMRCEWAMNGANPTSGTDTAEVVASSSGSGYVVGVQPDRNYRGFSYDFGEHASPDGVIEEYTTAQNSSLKNKLLVVRYSAGKDIIVLTPGGTNQDIVQAQTLISGLTNFNPSPLDLTENRSTGHLYIAQLNEQTGSGKLTLVRPK
ncbi:NPCBM/NEW2 domain-containing protein [Deinococcus apachensis]|uniref:NPCBM/NEW2 domain-containing protein n=1 Tax=Deinococcus apachensis TaxID=309886 RepID=UPI000369943A|nr:NPCBM/NEW2 domain-containing protein [Deinococcus apachensis]